MRALLVAIAGLLAACGGGDSAEPNSTTVSEPSSTTVAGPITTTTVDDDGSVRFVGDERPARLVIPPTWPPDGNLMPLVVLLHGYGASGELQDIYLGISATGADLGYLTLTPNGTMDTRGNRFWNASSLDGFVDDTGYLVGLIDQVVEDYNGDPNRVYLVGHSNGGFMANKIACEMPDRIAGIAAIAGGIFGVTTNCAGPMRVIFVQGTDDGTVPYEGGSFLGAPVLGALDTVDRWREAGGCSATSQQVGSFNFDLLTAGEETTITSWTDCDGGGSVELWTMEGSGHIPGFLPSFRSAIMEQLLGLDGT
jgi:polyhydroxybutyrate depolymerase